MTELTASFAIAREAIGLTREPAATLSQDAAEGRRGAAHPRLVAAPRDLYFSPAHARETPGRLANGATEDQDVVRHALIDFNDAERRVESRLRDLSFDSPTTRRLPLRHRRPLDSPALGKANLRARIREELNVALTMDENVDPEVAGELLDAVNELNDCIEELEMAMIGGR